MIQKWFIDFFGFELGCGLLIMLYIFLMMLIIFALIVLTQSIWKEKHND